MELIVFFISILFLILTLKLREKSNKLEIKIKQLESFLLSKNIITPSDLEPLKNTIKSSSLPAQNLDQEKSITENQSNLKKEVKSNLPKHQHAVPTVVQKNTQKWVAWLQDNWTGALGMSILVLSVIFGFVYLGLSSTPFTRFLMILSFAIASLVASYCLREKKQWGDFSLWLQGAGGSLILVAFLGSSYFEALKFYNDPFLGLIMLGMGLLLNVLLAYLTPQEKSSVFHVSLSLLALNFAPPVLPVLYAATIVALAGLLLSYRKKWDWNILGCTLAFSVFFVNWWFNQPIVEHVSTHSIIVACIIGFAGIFVPYGEIYKNAPYSTLSLSAHLIPWITLGINLTLFSLGVSWAFAIVGAVSILSFFLARVANKNNVAWLYTCDTLIAQTLALLAVGMLYRLIPNLETLVWIAIIEILVFTVMMSVVQQKWLTIIGLISLGILTVFHTQLTLSIFVNNTSSAEILWARTLVLATLFYLARYHQSKQPHNNLWDQAFNTMLDILFFIYTSFLIIFLTKLPFSPFIYIAIGVALERVLRNTKLLTQNNHRIALYMLVIEMLAVCWHQISSPDLSVTHSIIYSTSSLVLVLSLYPGRILEGFPKAQTRLEDIWVYLFGLHLAIGSYLILRLYSDFLPGIFMLVLSLLSFELAYSILRGSTKSERRLVIARGLKNISVVFMMAFMILYITIYIQSEANLLHYLSLRLSIGFIAVCMSLYLFINIAKINNSSNQVILTLWNQKYESWLTSLPADFALYLSVILVALELPTAWHPFVYALLGILVGFNGFNIQWPKRFIYYRLALLVTAAVYIAGVVSTWNSPLDLWYYDTRLTGVLSILATTFLAYSLAMDLQRYKPSSFNKITRFIQNDPLLYTMVIPFISFAFFLYWRFDHAILTAFWVGEIFALVSLGLFLKHKRMVQLSLALLLLCVARLVVYDLSQTDLLARTFVFATVGGLMVSIHVLYKKFSPRLK